MLRSPLEGVEHTDAPHPLALADDQEGHRRVAAFLQARRRAIDQKRCSLPCAEVAIFFTILLRLPPNKFLRIPPDLSPVSIRLALLFLLLTRGARIVAQRYTKRLMASSMSSVCRMAWACSLKPHGRRSTQSPRWNPV